MAINKKLWLIRLLRQHPQGLTRQEILHAWADEDDRGRPMPPSTFHDQCNEMMRIYGVRAVLRNGRYALEHTDKGEVDFFNFLLERNEDFNVSGGEYLPNWFKHYNRYYCNFSLYAVLEKLLSLDRWYGYTGIRVDFYSRERGWLVNASS